MEPGVHRRRLAGAAGREHPCGTLEHSAVRGTYDCGPLVIRFFRCRDHRLVSRRKGSPTCLRCRAPDPRRHSRLVGIRLLVLRDRPRRNARSGTGIERARRQHRRTNRRRSALYRPEPGQGLRVFRRRGCRGDRQRADPLRECAGCVTDIELCNAWQAGSRGGSRFVRGDRLGRQCPGGG